MIGKKIIRFEKIESTNDYIKNHLNSLEHGTVVIADEQTKGRGRFGNYWESKAGNLYLSVIFKNQEFNDNIFNLHIKTSMAIVQLLREYNIESAIKFPNDIIVNKKKIAGVLVETVGYSTAANVILGIGLNVNQNDFEILNDKATSLKIQTGNNTSIESLTNDFLDIFNQRSDMDKVFRNYLGKSIIIGKDIVYKDQRYEIITISREGQITIKNKDNYLKVDYDKLSLSQFYNNLWLYKITILKNL